MHARWGWHLCWSARVLVFSLFDEVAIHRHLAWRKQYTMLHDARHAAPHHHFGSKWSRTGGMRRAPTDQICLDFLFLGGVTPCASVVWGLMHQCSAMDWKREEVLLLIECYRKHPCLWNSTLKYYKCKDRLKWYKNNEIRLRKQ